MWVVACHPKRKRAYFCHIISAERAKTPNPRPYKHIHPASHLTVTLLGGLTASARVAACGGRSSATATAGSASSTAHGTCSTTTRALTANGLPDHAVGTFQQDYAYVVGSGDLEECNGRTDVTPEFPVGIYHYNATDSFPFFQRCVKGTLNIVDGGAFMVLSLPVSACSGIDDDGDALLSPTELRLIMGLFVHASAERQAS